MITTFAFGITDSRSSYLSRSRVTSGFSLYSSYITESSTVTIGQRGDSGRAVTLLIDDHEVNAAALRIAIGSTKMRSTMLNTLSIRDGAVRMSGRGYGHGVGMSQWGAYGMARQGKTSAEIITHYFRNVELEQLW